MIGSIDQIYLDNNATTRPLPEVVDAVVESMTTRYGNPSSPHQLGAGARDALSEARHRVADLVGSEPEQILFTSGGTEANNLVLQGVCSHKQGARLVTTAIEHSSVLKTAQALQDADIEITVLPVDQRGRVSPPSLEAALEEPASLVSVQWANSETGTVQPIEELGEICRRRLVPFHVDAAQAIGRVPISLPDLPVDFLTFTAHKIHGPKGIGAICSKEENMLSPLLFGGDQESGMRPGTENLPGIIGFGIAADVRSRQLNEAIAHLEALRGIFEEHLAGTALELHINGDRNNRVPNTSNIHFPSVEGMALMAQLDQVGIICSQTSACVSQRPEPSHVLLAMGLTEDQAFASVRFSFSVLNSLEEAEQAAESVCSVYQRLLVLERLTG